MAGVARQRMIPAFAGEAFGKWLRRGVSPGGGGGPAPSRGVEDPPPHQPSQVMLWPDTFNNYFHPHTAQAAVDVLEAAGFHRDKTPPTPIFRGAPLELCNLGQSNKHPLENLGLPAPQDQSGGSTLGARGG